MCLTLRMWVLNEGTLCSEFLLNYVFAVLQPLFLQKGLFHKYRLAETDEYVNGII